MNITQQLKSTNMMMNSIRKIKIALLGTLLFVTFFTNFTNNIHCIAKSYKNKLLNISVNNVDSKSAQITIFTENLYNLKINPIKKDSNKYVIFLPGTIEILKNKPSLANVKGTIEDIQVQYVPLLGSNDSYTKIIITTSNEDVSINLKNKITKKVIKKKTIINENTIPKIKNKAIAKKAVVNTVPPKKTELIQPPKKPITKEVITHDLPIKQKNSTLPLKKQDIEDIKIVKIKDSKQEAKSKGFLNMNFLTLGLVVLLFIGGIVLLKSILKKKTDNDNYVDEIDENFDNLESILHEDMPEEDEEEEKIQILPTKTTTTKEDINILNYLSKYDYVLLIDSNSSNIQKMAQFLAKKEINLLLAGNDKNKLKEIAQKVTMQYNVNVKTYDFNITEFYKHKSFYKELDYKPVGVILDIDYKGDAKKLSDNYNFVEVKKVIDSNFTNYISIGNIVVEELINNKKGFIGFVKDNNIEDIDKLNYIYLSSKLATLTYISGLQSKFSNKPVKIVSLDPENFDEVEGRELQKQEKIVEKTKAIASLF